MLLLRQRYGVKLVPIPDRSGGDGGLDAYTTDGIGWQCYAPENEPLTPKARYEAQRGKVTSDLKKLWNNADRVRELLGSTVLTEWVLLTPKHESADLVAHCATKSAEVVAKGLDFIHPGFRVLVQDLTDFELESRLVQSHRILPNSLHKPAVLREVDLTGVPFSEATGPLIQVMDEKLKMVIKADKRRAVYRGGLLRAKIAGDDQLARFDDYLPDVASELRGVIANAKRRMEMDQALEDFTARHLRSVQNDVAQHIKHVIPEMDVDAVEFLSQASITQWLQECSMTFESEVDGDGDEIPAEVNS